MKLYLGYLSVIVATLLFGIWNTFNKILLNDLDPIALSALVYVIAGIFLFSIRVSPLKDKILDKLNSGIEVETLMSRKDYFILLITAILGSVIAPVIYLNGLNLITAVNASLLMNVEILFIIVIGIFFLKEKFNRKEIFGFFFLIIGTLFFTMNGQLGDFSVSTSLGSVLIIVAAFFWSIDTSLSKFLSNKRDLILITALKCSIGGFILFFLSLKMGLHFKIPLNQIPYLLFIGLISIGFSFVLIYFSIRQIGSTRTGSLFSLSSLFGAIFAFIILKEPFTFSQLFFGLIMLMGVFILFKMKSK
jgi:drug/metabolite transporter (DMT)-like permease